MQSVLLDSFLIVWKPPVEITTPSGLVFSLEHVQKQKGQEKKSLIHRTWPVQGEAGSFPCAARGSESLPRDTGFWDRRFDDVVARLLIATMAQIRRRSRRSDPSCSGLFLDGIIAQLGFVVVTSFCTDD